LLVGLEVFLYLYLKPSEGDMELTKTILILAATGIAAVCLIITIFKGSFVWRRMVRGKEDFNKIKNSLISE
jgi:hypothetical protein